MRLDVFALGALAYFVLAGLACAVLGVGLLTAIMGAGSSTPPPALDVLVSGLVVGAGTKPLHDLITNIQAS